MWRKKTSIHIREMYLKVTAVTDTALIMATKHLSHVEEEIVVYVHL